MPWNHIFTNMTTILGSYPGERCCDQDVEVSLHMDNFGIPGNDNSKSVRLLTGGTPIPGGSAVGERDITLLNSYLAISFAVQTSPPWGVARGGIIDAGVIRDGHFEMNRVILVDFLPNGWSSWHTTFQQVEILLDTPEKGVVQTTRDWEGCELKTVYTLTKEDNRVHLMTTMTNQSKSDYADILSGYVLRAHGGHLFVPPERTRQENAKAAPADWMVCYDETWAVGIHAPDINHFDFHTGDMYRQHTLKPGESHLFEGWLHIVDKGDISAMGAFEMVRTRQYPGTVAGSVFTVDGRPVAHPVVVVEKNGRPFTWILGNEGGYSLTLPRGDYEIHCTGKNHGSSGKKWVSVESQEVVTLNFTDVDYPGRLVFNIYDQDNSTPLDARISIEKGHIPVVGFLGQQVFFTALEKKGKLEIPVAPGSYCFKISHGESFISKSVRVETCVMANEIKTLTVVLERGPNPRNSGWYACDMHHHSNLLDGQSPPEDVTSSQLAAALDFTLVSDHDLVTNHPTMKQLSHLHNVPFIPSMEISSSWGHFNVFPVLPGKTLPIDPGTATVHEIFAAARQMGAMAICANHPYISYGYFYSLERETVPGGYNEGFDLLELNSGRNNEKTLEQIRCLWNQGRRYYLSAGTDNHNVKKDISGKIRMFAKIEGPPTPEKFISALMAGNSYASLGPVVESDIMFGREVAIYKGEAFKLNVMVRAVEGLKEVQLFKDGVVVDTVVLAPGETEKKISFESTPLKNSWYSLVVSDLRENMAWTNPIWVKLIVPESSLHNF